MEKSWELGKEGGLGDDKTGVLNVNCALLGCVGLLRSYLVTEHTFWKVTRVYVLISPLLILLKSHQLETYPHSPLRLLGPSRSEVD